eukprot:s1186_g12.t1
MGKLKKGRHLEAGRQRQGEGGRQGKEEAATNSAKPRADKAGQAEQTQPGQAGQAAQAGQARAGRAGRAQGREGGEGKQGRQGNHSARQRRPEDLIEEALAAKSGSTENGKLRKSLGTLRWLMNLHSYGPANQIYLLPTQGVSLSARGQWGSCTWNPSNHFEKGGRIVLSD